MSERADWLKSPGIFFGGHHYTLDSREQVHIPPLEKGNPSSQLPQKGKCVWPPSSCHLNHLPIQAFPWRGTTAKSRKTSLGRHPVATIRVVRACFKVRLDVRSGNMETLPKSLPQNITAVGVYPVISIGFISTSPARCYGRKRRIFWHPLEVPKATSSEDVQYTCIYNYTYIYNMIDIPNLNKQNRNHIQDQESRNYIWCVCVKTWGPKYDRNLKSTSIPAGIS